MTAPAKQETKKATNEAATVKSGNPTTTSKSEMLRVGLVFSHWAREQVEKEGVTLAQFTDMLPAIVDEALGIE